ncbi:aminotransferase class I/II-fold pyridoxal phosphate-dependent enzyme [Paraconexibacter antarcticus]|uniref:Aminotransferase class I/II-fold pyridoxal phosphate-dependent enzyme n=1 Tax=Paraconexibacter antarcticus TaxID=2949664 RepID=A0ABY5DP54_9ACTN|nr:aminotransferase class I/II-fold pyridoxal phosphate-dependent enzyme [Paraconexibacter antarcticus]UTI63816.1 aminotransferase class I/II-fold pyridoxal phosphate-dependent enzyme [Paraconexibacter antarcticus]
MRGFASDNYAGIHPEVLAAITAANDGTHAKAYGADPVTARMEALFREHFGEDARAYVMFNGTGANVTALRACCRPWEGVICADTAHVHVDEGGAPERMGGLKLLTTPTPDGKLTPADVARLTIRVGDEHAVQARVVTVTQPTELGTLYSLEELRALAEAAHARGLLLHVDGARLANAAVALGTGFRAFTTDAGVDVLTFGATKNGALGAEAVVFLTAGLDDGFLYLRKQSMQLASKGRFYAAQLAAQLDGDLWHRAAAQANAMAQRLAAGVAAIDGVRVTQAVQASAVFAILPPVAATQVMAAFPFYVWDEHTGEVRWMCSWDTTEAEVDGFVAAIAQAVAQAG